jgi:RNA ligase
MVEKKYVRRQTHPTLPFAIYNYTAAAQYDKQWNPVTLSCRGLVTRTRETNALLNPHEVIVSRPWAKFFNYAEHSQDSLPTTNSVVVTEKMDGSLGISVPTGDGIIVATRGSFTSDQALHATRVLRERYAAFTGEPEYTYLWEIVYPENRIVVNYGDTDDLVLLGAVDVASGRSVPLSTVAQHWRGPVVATHAHTSLAAALAAPDRDNTEGVVVQFVDADLRIKIKQDDYVALHKVVTNLSERAIWEVLAEHGTVASLLDVVPDEYYPWVHEVSERLQSEHAHIENQVADDTTAIITELANAGIARDAPEFRKEFALRARTNPLGKWMFTHLDGRSSADKIWTSIKPDPIKPAWLITHTDDTN